MRRKRLMSAALAMVLVVGTAVPVQASTIEEAQQQGQELENQKDTAEAEKQALADQLNSLIDEMDQTAEKISKKEEEISAKEDELIQAQIDENNQYESMKKRIKYMYENGNTQFFEILLESKSIGDLLNNAEYISQVSEYDRTALNEYQDTVKSVDEQKTQLESEQADLEKLQTQLQTKQDELNTLISEKADEISSLEVAIGENAAKLQALQEEAEKQARLQAEAAAAAKQASNTNANNSSNSNSNNSNNNNNSNNSNNSNNNNNSSSNSGSYSGSGALSNPCPSAYISSEFGGRTSPGGIGSTNHKGRDYAASAGSAILAAASGTVTTVSYSSARGNYLVINHGNGLSTLYQHCSAIYVSSGQSVSVGQNIAAVGSTGNSTGPHLHFEVWVNGTPVDPRLYL